MNYYKRHLGDYARDTGHLSALEHGVYTLLLDWYYANERPIPPDKTERIGRGNPKETQTVLEEFFKLTDSGWINRYADRVIAEYNAKADRNRQSGKLGGRPKKTQTVSKENPNITLAISHKPLVKEQKKDQEHVPQAARFPEFWSVYPIKRGKKTARSKWAAKKLDGIADRLIADVRNRIAKDKQWRGGFIPHASTYLTQERWDDELGGGANLEPKPSSHLPAAVQHKRMTPEEREARRKAGEENIKKIEAMLPAMRVNA